MEATNIRQGGRPESLPLEIGSDDEPTPLRKRPQFRVVRTDDAPRVAIAWRHPGAAIELAEALGVIAADLWIAGKVTLD